jgi:hypothetical protein
MAVLVKLCIITAACALLLGAACLRQLPAHAAAVPARQPGIGSVVHMQGFAVTLVDVVRTQAAGAAHYVPAHGNVFLFVTVRIARETAREPYFASPLDFALESSNGTVFISEPFGVRNELASLHLGKSAVTVVIGFEVPARASGLQLLWQPALASNPDVQATWWIGEAGKTTAFLP